MGRGKALTSDEKGKIIAYKECKLTYREIAEKIGKSKSVVCNFLKNTSGYGKNMKGRTKKKNFRVLTSDVFFEKLQIRTVLLPKFVQILK